MLDRIAIAVCALPAVILGAVALYVAHTLGASLPLF